MHAYTEDQSICGHNVHIGTEDECIATPVTRCIYEDMMYAQSVNPMGRCMHNERIKWGQYAPMGTSGLYVL